MAKGLRLCLLNCRVGLLIFFVYHHTQVLRETDLTNSFSCFTCLIAVSALLIQTVRKTFGAIITFKVETGLIVITKYLNIVNTAHIAFKYLLLNKRIHLNIYARITKNFQITVTSN